MTAGPQMAPSTGVLWSAPAPAIHASTSPMPAEGARPAITTPRASDRTTLSVVGSPGGETASSARQTSGGPRNASARSAAPTTQRRPNSARPARKTGVQARLAMDPHDPAAALDDKDLKRGDFRWNKSTPPRI